MNKAFRSAVKRLSQMFGLEVRNRRSLYVDHLEDLTHILGERRSSPIIFDVGANCGDTVSEYRRVFSNSEVHAFEPTPTMSSALVERFKSDPRVKVICEAISDERGKANFNVFSSSVMNSMLQYQVPGYAGTTQETNIVIPTTTITSYCDEHQIDTIDILKLDIQGSEKRALAGASRMLDDGKIEALYLEVHFFPVYQGQPLFGDIETILHSAGYRLYGLYEVHREGNGCLHFCNVLYVSPRSYARLKPLYLR